MWIDSYPHDNRAGYIPVMVLRGEEIYDSERHFPQMSRPARDKHSTLSITPSQFIIEGQAELASVLIAPAPSLRGQDACRSAFLRSGHDAILETKFSHVSGFQRSSYPTTGKAITQNSALVLDRRKSKPLPGEAFRAQILFPNTQDTPHMTGSWLHLLSLNAHLQFQ